MIGSVFKEVKGIFGKAYLLAGLLPAAFLLLGYDWFSQGDQAFKLLIQTLLEPKQHSGTTLLHITEILVLGFIFYAIRIPLMEFVQDMPGRWIRPVREFLISRKTARLRDWEEKRIVALWKVTVARWYEERFAPRTYLPPGIEALSPKQALRKSRSGREIVESVVARGSQAASWRECDSILTSLCSFYVCTSDSKDYNEPLKKDLKKELDAWNDLVASSNHAKTVMEDVDFYARRQFTPVFARLQAYPSLIGLRPTAVGNEMAALDEYSKKRYGMDASSMWARLREVVPKFSRDEVSAAELNLETILNLLLASLVLLLAEVVRVVAGFNNGAFRSFANVGAATLLFMVSTVVVVVVLHWGVVYSAGTFRQRVVSLLDVYCLNLVATLGFRPKTVGERDKLLRDLRNLFVQAVAMNPNLPIVAAAKGGEEENEKKRNSAENDEQEEHEVDLGDKNGEDEKGNAN